MGFLEPSLTSSTDSSMTRFMNGSKPRRIPVTFLPPFSFTIVNERKNEVKLTES